MKKIICLMLSLMTLPSFAQIDDVINKPRVKVQNEDPSMYTSMFKNVLNILKSVEVTNLVDTMRSEGKTESKFYASFGVNGAIVNVGEMAKDSPSVSVLPFTVKMDNAKNIYIVASAIGINNFFADYLDNKDYYSGLNPIQSAQLAIFKIDDGYSFRDIRTVGFRVADINLAIPINGISSSRYVAFTLGAAAGGDQEKIRMDDGQLITIGGGNGLGTINGGYECMSVEHCKTGTTWLLRGGLEISDQLGQKGILKASGKVEYQQLRGGEEATGIDYMHTSLYAKPEISYTRPVSKNGKTSLTLGVNANIGLVNNLKGWNDGFDSDRSDNSPTSVVDLKNRNRQPVQLKAVINF